MDLGIIQKLAKSIVRPPKAAYDVEDLVPRYFQMKNRIYIRKDFTVFNNRGLKIQGTLIKGRYEPAPRGTIIFLHANGSSRLVMKSYLDVFLPHYDLASFDFAGCGLSEGEFITLGYNQRQDVYSVINYLRKEQKINDFVLWGRSMGAATALLYAAKYGCINAIISDNSYSDLQKLVNQLSDDYLPFLPSFLLDSIINSIQQYIENILWKKESTDFHLRKLKPISIIEKIQCPIMYIGSLEDTFVNVSHTKSLFNNTKAYKQMQLVGGNHNDFRTQKVQQKVLKFIFQYAKVVKSQSNPFNTQRPKIFVNPSLERTKAQQNNALNGKNIPSPFEVDLVNCAEIEFQTQQKAKISTLQTNQSLFRSKTNSQSYHQIRQTQLQRQNKYSNRLAQRSRSKIKRKKIFEGISTQVNTQTEFEID